MRAKYDAYEIIRKSSAQSTASQYSDTLPTPSSTHDPSMVGKDDYFRQLRLNSDKETRNWLPMPTEV
jgi:hypothetical protein